MFFVNSIIDINRRRLTLPDYKEKLSALQSELRIVLADQRTSAAQKKANQIREKLLVKQPGYSFNASFSNVAGKLLYKNEIILNQSEAYSIVTN